MNRHQAAIAVNLAGSQAGWWATVLLAAHGRPGAATAAGAACTVLLLAQAGRRWRTEAGLALAALVIGTAWDSLLVNTGLLVYPPGPGPGLAWLAPPWIMVLWALFATTLNVSMRWLRGRWVLAALFGAIGGPLSFAAGARLGAVRFSDTPVALLALAAGWAVLMPLLVRLAQGFDAPVPEPSSPSSGVLNHG
ncbi:MAG: DUF2878 domain-containing protein [Pseudomonadota bacterium]